MGRAVVFLLSVLLAVGCQPASAQDSPKQGSQTKASAAPAKQVTLQKGVTVGEPSVFGNLAVLPIFATVQKSIGELTTLAQALASQKAEVREVTGAESVNELVIENKGKQIIFVLAGTVVKGGNQDRQIAQDFVIGASQTVPIDAYCVEQGRWDGARQGQATGGKFEALDTLADSKVRVAGQYQRSQSKVWAEVAEVNRKNRKVTSSGTLTATLEDKQVAAARQQLASQVLAFLAARQPQENLVGFAYAIDGKVRGVRWFLNHQVFALHLRTLVNSAAVESLTAQAAAKASRKKPPAPLVSPLAVAQFVSEIEKVKLAEARQTKAANTNMYRMGKDGAGSKVMYKAAPKAAPAPVSHDYTAF